MKKTLAVIILLTFIALSLFAIEVTNTEDASIAKIEEVQQEEQGTPTNTNAIPCPHYSQSQSPTHDCTASKTTEHRCSYAMTGGAKHECKNAKATEHKCSQEQENSKCEHGKDGHSCGEKCCKVTGDKSSCCSAKDQKTDESKPKATNSRLGCGGSKN